MRLSGAFGPFGGRWLLLILLPLVVSAPPLDAHIDNEVAIGTKIVLEEDAINLTITFYAGMLFGNYYLEILDPDGNKAFEEENIHDFSRFITDGIVVELDGAAVTPELNRWELSSFESFVGGASKARFIYRVPFPSGGTAELFYENRLEKDIAIYALQVKGKDKAPFRILKEERNETLQNHVLLTLTDAPIPPAAASEPHLEGAASAAASGITSPLPVDGQTEFVGSNRIIRRISTGDVNRIILIVLALGIGFLHAFTPGHGKSLVGAYLVANRGNLVQAFGLGIVVTLTHTLSIYLIAGLASAATYVFMPSSVIPVMSVITGVLIILIALGTAAKRILGLETDHAHILPNLKVLREKEINIVVDGGAVDSTDLLALELENDEFQRDLESAGAEGVNICSPGCETHRFMPSAIQERQSRQLMTLAVETGAVEAVISSREAVRKKLGTMNAAGSVDIVPRLSNPKDAAEFLNRALKNYRKRDGFRIPDDHLSWKKLVPLGIAGGAVPCPDALAILLIAVSLGRPALGMGIVFVFSLGLAAALVLIGSAVVMSRKLVYRAGWFKGMSKLLPFISTVFLCGLGLYIILKNFDFLF